MPSADVRLRRETPGPAAAGGPTPFLPLCESAPLANALLSALRAGPQRNSLFGGIR